MSSALTSVTLDQAAFNVVEVLGEGSFGEVLLMEYKQNPNVVFAVKKISTEDHDGQKIRKECLLQMRTSRVGHENVIRMVGNQSDNKFSYLFLEFADAGDLFDEIEPKVGMSPELAQFYFRQLIAGLKFIHENDIVHRDIKPDNLLLTSSYVLKISDFGLAALYRDEEGEFELDEMSGTAPFAAPEVISGQQYKGPPVDVWSAGVVLIAMLTGDVAWATATDSSPAYRRWRDNCTLDEDPWKKIDVRGLCFLRSIVNEDVDRRATVLEIEADPWFTHDFDQLESTGSQ